VNPGRRRALRVLAGTGAATAAAASPVAASRASGVVPPEAVGMLYDTTRCIGCKACVSACLRANDLEPDRSPDGLYQAPLGLNSRTKNVIKLYKDEQQTSYVKMQCMHCVDPACASACMLGSLHKDETTGIVSYDPSYCVGCRYCQMACPFEVTKFEFDKAVPKIVKCELCRHRVQDATFTQTDSGFSRYPRGHGPACCEVCPREAVIYGKRSELLAEAKRRLDANPDAYVPKVYGETEAGGTQVLYLSHVDFEKLGLPDYGDQGIPHVAYAVQEGIYKGFIAPVALYTALGLVMLRNRKKEDGPDAADSGKGVAP
jgi:Fe-S-cluster-containing dehydrogenase component